MDPEIFRERFVLLFYLSSSYWLEPYEKVNNKLVIKGALFNLI